MTDRPASGSSTARARRGRTLKRLNALPPCSCLPGRNHAAAAVGERLRRAFYQRPRLRAAMGVRLRCVPTKGSAEMVRAFVLYESEPDPEWYERHAELCGNVPGATFRHGTSGNRRSSSLAVWLAALLLRNNAARVRCWLWTAASIKFLLPLSMLVSLGEQFQWRTAPAAVQPAVLFVMEDVLAPADVIAVVPASIPPAAPVWPWLLLAAWCTGAAVVLVSWRRQWLPIRAALRRATPVKLDAKYGAGDLEVMSSPSMPEPAVVGIRRPRLVLPEGIVERLTPAQLRALIAHERCHIRYRDNLTAAIHMAVEAMFWFHPAVWWIESRLIDERERACDEAVLQSGIGRAITPKAFSRSAGSRSDYGWRAWPA